MNILLWTFQAFLAATFLYSGICKSLFTRERLVAMGQTGVARFSIPAIRSIAALEILGAAGLVLPWALEILPGLTPLAAAGFAFIMLLAAPIHARRGEWKSVALNTVLFGISTFVAYARLRQLWGG